MYAIIRSGGKQSKVQEGDVIDVERLKGVAPDAEVSFTPLLLVNDDGSVIADAGKLGKASVTAKVLGEHRGEKIDVFKYKNKSGYRRSQGHRQTYTTIEVTGIDPGVQKSKKKTKKSEAAEPETATKSTKSKSAKSTAAKNTAADTKKATEEG